MKYRFTGAAPEEFPTIIVADPADPPHGRKTLGLVQPGDVFDVLTADGNDGGLVIHARLEPADTQCAAAHAQLVAHVDALNRSLRGEVEPDSTEVSEVGTDPGTSADKIEE